MIEIPYNRQKVLEYAQKWAYDGKTLLIKEFLNTILKK